MWSILNKLERLAPQWFLALVIIMGAIVVLIYREPPHQMCDTQKQSYILQQRKFLASSNYDKFFERCLQSNSRGGCEPYFSGFKKILDDFKVLDESCHEKVAASSRVKTALSSFLIQVSRLAWGDEGPRTNYERMSWLGPGHLRVFCRVKSRYKLSYGEVAYSRLLNTALGSLPNGQRLKKAQIYERSLFATSCGRYF